MAYRKGTKKVHDSERKAPNQLGSRGIKLEIRDERKEMGLGFGLPDPTISFKFKR